MAVDDEEGFGVFGLEELGDAFDVVADAGGGLGGLDEDCAGFEFESGFDFVEGEGLAVGFFDDVGVAAEGFDEGGPALADLPAVRTRTRSPGEVRLRRRPPWRRLPPLERMMTSFLEPTNSFNCAKDSGV